MVALRPMRIDDVQLLAEWDDDPDVAAALDGRGQDWYDWPTELARNVPWRELLVAEEDGRPFGFIQLTDAHAEESHFWGDVPAGTWAVDIWIGSPQDRGRGLGTQAMGLALKRVFELHGATTTLIDPLISNRRAISFYERLGFEAIAEHSLDDDCSLVMRLLRPGDPWWG